MSVISRFSVYSHCNDLGGKVWNPAIRWTKKYAVFVVLENNHGASGIGECWCFDSKPDSLIAYLKTEIAPSVVGKNQGELATLHQNLLNRATLTARHGILASAWAGVDIALWDLLSHQAGLPLWQYIQQQQPALRKFTDTPVQLYASAGLYGENKTVNDLAVEMQSIEAAGFNLVKMKIGGLPVEQDKIRVHAVLDALTDSCDLIIDGVYSYTAEQALKFYKELPARRINAFQSPLKACDLSGMARLTEACVPVMGTEAEYRHEMHDALIKTNSVRYLQVAPIAIGGITRVLELAQAIPVQVKLSLEVSSTAVAFSTAFHLAKSCDVVEHVEYHYVHQVFFNELQYSPEQFMNEEGEYFDKPGIGITLDDIPVTAEFALP